MQTPTPGKLLRILISERDQINGRPLHEAIVGVCRELKIAGATVFKGLEGYGEMAEIHHSRWIGHDQPIVINVVDSNENIQDLITALDPILDTGLMALSEVEMIRIENGSDIKQAM